MRRNAHDPGLAEMNRNTAGFDHLDRTGRLAARLVLAPRAVTYTVVTALVFASWLLLFAMAANAPAMASGPGGSLLQGFSGIYLPAQFEALLRLCASPMMQVDAGIATFAALTLMWFMMGVAMMLPSAAPLIRTYCEIADTANSASKAVVHPLWLVSGYLAVWGITAIVFASANIAVGFVSGTGAALSPLSLPVSAATLAFAGLYQFSGLKEACLKKCRNPFSTLFANWSVERRSIFSLGVKQGIWCFGCCWALMLIMFAVGIMNIFWMALLAVFTVIEKTGNHAALSHVVGALLLVWALALLLFSI